MNPLAIFAGPYGMLAKWGLMALLVGAFGLWSWFKGNEHGTQKLIDYQAKQAIEAVRIAKGRETVTIQMIARYVKVQGATQVVTQTVEREVVRYAEANPGFCLDPAWRVLHDAAALNSIPASPGRADAAGGAPKAAEALAGVTENYEACHRTADRLDALQGWVKQQAAMR